MGFRGLWCGLNSNRAIVLATKDVLSYCQIVGWQRDVRDDWWQLPKTRIMGVSAVPTRLSPYSFSRVRQDSPCTKGCQDRWSKHVSPKLKSEKNKNGSNYFECLYTHTFFMLLLGLL